MTLTYSAVSYMVDMSTSRKPTYLRQKYYLYWKLWWTKNRQVLLCITNCGARRLFVDGFELFHSKWCCTTTAFLPVKRRCVEDLRRKNVRFSRQTMTKFKSDYWMRLGMALRFIKVEVSVFPRSRRLKVHNTNRGLDKSQCHTNADCNNCFIIQYWS